MYGVSAIARSTVPCAVAAEYDIMHLCVIQIYSIVLCAFSFAAHKYQYRSTVIDIEYIIICRGNLLI